VIYAICLILAVMSLVLSGSGQLYAFMGLAMLFGLVLLLIERLSDRSVPTAAGADGDTAGADGEATGADGDAATDLPLPTSVDGPH
jgi:hypothetical protein